MSKKLNSMQRLIGSTAWRREIAPVRAEMLAEMDDWHQQRLLMHTTHCRLWKKYAGRTADLVAEYDRLLIAALDAKDHFFATAKRWDYVVEPQNRYRSVYVGPVVDGWALPGGAEATTAVGNAEFDFEAAADALYQFLRFQGAYGRILFKMTAERPPFTNTAEST